MSTENMIDYIEIPAGDIEATKRFFTGLFGWEFANFGQDYCSFNDGRLAGGFFKSDKIVSTDAGSPLLVFYREDLESAQDRVGELGGEIVKDIFSFPGGRRFHFTDPNGNEYAIWSDKGGK